jgi:PBSX family phage terminase large subunit
MNQASKPIFSQSIKLNKKSVSVISNVKNQLFTWLEGSSQSGKSVAAALAFAALIEDSATDDYIFLVVGYTSTSAKNNVSFCGGFGLEHYFGSKARKGKYYGSDCLYIKTKTGQKVVGFMNGSNKSSNEAFHGWPVAGFVLDEIDRLHQNVIDEVKQRIQARPNAHIIATQNPNSPNHPIYKELDFYQKKDSVNYIHFTLEDNPALSQEDRRKVIDRYDPESVFYKRFVLGQRVVADNLIYNVRDYNVIDTFEPKNYVEYVVVADPGENASATAFILLAITKGYTELHVLKEYWHRNADHRYAAIKMPIDYANDFVDFIDESVKMMGRYPSTIYTDLDVTFQRELRQALTKSGMAQLSFKNAIKFDIEDRIKQGVSLLYTGKLKFAKQCNYTIESFKSSQYEPSKAAVGQYERYDNPVMGTKIDAIDAVEYGFTHFLNKIYKK